MIQNMHANIARRGRAHELQSHAAKILLTLCAILGLCLPASGQTCNGNPLSYWTAMLGDLSPSRQFQAAFALGQCGPGAAPGLPALDQALRDQATDLRPRIAIARAILLIDRNSPAQDIVEFLAGLVQRQREVWAREDAIEALGAAGPRACAAVPLIRAARNTSIGSTQLKVQRALQNIGSC